jgi:hypothetical protein
MSIHLEFPSQTHAFGEPQPRVLEIGAPTLLVRIPMLVDKHLSKSLGIPSILIRRLPFTTQCPTLELKSNAMVEDAMAYRVLSIPLWTK